MRRRLLALFSLLVLLVVGGLWWRSAPPARDAGAASGVVDTATPPSPAQGTLTPTPPPVAEASEQAGAPMRADAIPNVTATPTPLPAPETAVAEIYDELLARARGGDANAACRLASELLRCQRHAAARGMMPRDPTDMISREDSAARRDRMIDYVARMEEEHALGDRLCRGVSEAQLDQAFALQQQAALARPELRVWAALHPALDTQTFVDDLEQWQQYRAVALPWLEAAAAEGDLTALIALARIHGDDRRAGPRSPPFRRIDDARMVTYATLLDRYGVSIGPVARSAEAALARLDPPTAASARERADALFRPDRVPAAADAREVQGEALRRSFANSTPEEDCG